MSSSTTKNSNPHAHKKKGEPHRIYWQQWIATSRSNNPPESNSSSTREDGRYLHPPPSAQEEEEQTLSRRELITSSAAVRVSEAAKAGDLTALLRQTLHLPAPAASTSTESAAAEDALVLVGTLYSLPRDYVQFEHELVLQQQELEQQQQHEASSSFLPAAATTTTITRTTGCADPFHVVQTIPRDQSPLVARQRMETYLQQFLERAAQQQQQQQQQQLPSTALTRSTSSGTISRTIISPKLQWYFVPAPAVAASVVGDSSSTTAASNNSNNNTVIPNCVELDGYCTSLEQDDQEDDSENSDDGHDDEDAASDDDDEDDTQWLASQFDWISPSRQQQQACSGGSSTQQYDKSIRQRRQRRRLARQDRLFAELQRQQTPSGSMTGYLLKRDARDPNVWRRVHCTLTADYLWFVSRIYTASTTGDDDADSMGGNSSEHPPSLSEPQQQPPHSQQPPQIYYRWARHGRIRLTRALVLEPTADYPPLFRTPYAWEIVSARGTSHVLRAGSRAGQRRWIRALQDAVVRSLEASLLRHAELLLTDECRARNLRAAERAVEPLWERLQAQQERDSGGPAEEDGTTAAKGTGGGAGTHVNAVLRLGLQVADYRECCRYIQTVLPAKNPMVVFGGVGDVAAQPPAMPKGGRFGSAAAARARSTSTESTVVPALDATTHDMIHATWDRAAALLVRATHVGLTMTTTRTAKKTSSEGNNHEVHEEAKLSHSVDTLCRHIDYVITGRFRRGKDYQPPSTMVVPQQPTTTTVLGNRVRAVSSDADHEFQPPPTDLFDHLLTELQIEAVAADHRRRSSSPSLTPSSSLS